MTEAIVKRNTANAFNPSAAEEKKEGNARVGTKLLYRGAVPMTRLLNDSILRVYANWVARYLASRVGESSRLKGGLEEADLVLGPFAWYCRGSLIRSSAIGWAASEQPSMRESRRGRNRFSGVAGQMGTTTYTHPKVV